MQKKYGLVIPEIITEGKKANYILGGFSKLKGEVINPSGDWTQYLPAGEPQAIRFETFGCTSFATNNAKEALEKFKTGNIFNNSDRVLYIASDTDPNIGNDPHKVAETGRKIGFAPEETLPYTVDIKTIQEFNSPKPLTPEIVKKANEFFNKFEFGHEWVFTSGSPQDKQEKLKEALTKGTVCVSVHAWVEKDGKYIKPTGATDNHWTMLARYDGDCPVIFDSYADGAGDPFLKTLSPFYDFSIAKVYYLFPSEKKISIFQQIINILAKIVGLQKILVNIQKPIEPIKEPVTEPVIEQKSRIDEWAKAIEQFESAPISWNNPGSIKGLDGKFLQFKTYEEGFKYLCDYLVRACTGKHRAYKPEFTLLQFFEVYAPTSDKNNPFGYCSFVSKRLGVEMTIQIKNLL